MSLASSGYALNAKATIGTGRVCLLPRGPEMENNCLLCGATLVDAYEHMRTFHPTEDLIDFKVSDAWRDYYVQRSMTPYPSPSYRDKQTRAIEALDKSIKSLAESIDAFVDAVLKLTTKRSSESAAPRTDKRLVPPTKPRIGVDIP